LLKNGGGWRWLAEIALFSISTLFLAVLFSPIINTHQHIHPKTYGKKIINTVGFCPTPTPKKWRWLAVAGGIRVFSAFLKLLKPAVHNCGISVAVRCSGCSKGHPEPRPQGSLNLFLRMVGTNRTQ